MEYRVCKIGLSLSIVHRDNIEMHRRYTVCRIAEVRNKGPVGAQVYIDK